MYKSSGGILLIEGSVDCGKWARMILRRDNMAVCIFEWNITRSCKLNSELADGKVSQR